MDSTHQSKNTVIQQAMKLIAKTIYTLLFILIIIATGVSMLSYTTTIHTPEMLIIFGVVSIGYILEVILSPYERILEVQQQYRQLMTAYTPYLVTVITLLITHYYHIINFNLLTLITTIQIARTISAGMMWNISRKKK